MKEGRPEFLRDNVSNCDSVNVYRSDNIVIIPDNPAQIAVIHKSSSVMLLVNGEAVSGVLEKGKYSTIQPSEQSLTIGSCMQTDSTSAYFTGSIDEVRLWKTAIAATQINASKNVELTGNESGPLSLRFSAD